MDKIRAWLQDSKNTPVVAAIAAVVLIGVILLFLKFYGVIGGGGPAPRVGPVEEEPPGVGAPAGVEGPGQQMPPGVEAPIEPGPPPTEATGAPAATPPPPAPAVKQDPMLPYRKDPFMAFTGPPTKTQALMALVPTVRRIRLAPANVGPRGDRDGAILPGDEILPPQPFRRVAGILWDSKVRAILETEGDVEIVQPGSVSSKGGSRVRVESIEPDGVVLKTLDTRTPMTIKVQLAGSIAARQGETAGQPGGGPAGSPYPEAPPPPGGRGGPPIYEGPPPGR